MHCYVQCFRHTLNKLSVSLLLTRYLPRILLQLPSVAELLAPPQRCNDHSLLLLRLGLLEILLLLRLPPHTAATPQATATDVFTPRPLSSSFLRLPYYKVLNINYKQELLRGPWVPRDRHIAGRELAVAQALDKESHKKEKEATTPTINPKPLNPKP